MNFYEALNELETLNESNFSGQATYKSFLIYLANFLGCSKPANYEDNWVLHHRDCKHTNNSQFENLVLMNPNHHRSLHRQCFLDPRKNIWKYLVEGKTKTGTKFEYWLIGEEIAARIDRKVTEEPVNIIIKEETFV